MLGIEVQGIGGMGLWKKNLRTSGCLWDFKANDIISDTRNPSSSWYGKNVKVLGFTEVSTAMEIESRLYGIIVGECNPLHTLDPQGLILLERLGYKFKVDDRVIVLEDNGAKELKKGMTGTIIILDPSPGFYPFLIQFNDWHEGDPCCAEDLWPYPWFPDKYKVKTDCHFWASTVFVDRFLGLIK